MERNGFKNRKKYVFSISEIVISILIIYTILFPRDILNIKEIFLLIALFVSVPILYKCQKERTYSSVFILGMIMPVITILISCIVGNSTFLDAFSSGYVWLYLLLIPIIVHNNIDIKRPFLFATQLIAILIVSTWVLDYTGLLQLNQNPIIIFFYDAGELQSLSKGVLAIFGYAIYYKSSVALIISLGFYVKEKRVFRSILLIIALFMTGARMNAVVALLVCVAILMFDKSSKSTRFFSTVLILVSAFMFLPDFLEQLKTVSTLKYNRSELIKFEGIRNTLSLLNNNKYMFLFGSGLGSYFYNTERGMFVQLFELSFIDYFRQVGLFGYMPFLYLIIKPMKYLFVNLKWVFIAYIGYLMIAATNPLLVNSTSFICYLMILTCAFEEKRHSLI